MFVCCRHTPIFASPSHMTFKEYLRQPSRRVSLWFTQRVAVYYANQFLAAVKAPQLSLWSSLYGHFMSQHLFLEDSVIGFEYPLKLPHNVMCVGPMDAHSPVGTLKPTLASFLQYYLTKRRHCVYVSMGTQVNIAGPVPGRIIKALSALGLCVVWPVPAMLRDRLPANLPGNFHIAQYTNQRAVLAHPAVRAFVSHCGMGGTQQSLLAGVPLICIPHASDQWEVALRIKHSGAGLAYMSVDDWDADMLQDDLQRMLKWPSSFARRSREVGDLLRQAGGAPQAARLVAAAVYAVLGRPLESFERGRDRLEPRHLASVRVLYSAEHKKDPATAALIEEEPLPDTSYIHATGVLVSLMFHVLVIGHAVWLVRQAWRWATRWWRPQQPSLRGRRVKATNNSTTANGHGAAYVPRDKDLPAVHRRRPSPA